MPAPPADDMAQQHSTSSTIVAIKVPLELISDGLVPKLVAVIVEL
jgi:hypothetical protein